MAAKRSREMDAVVGIYDTQGWPVDIGLVGDTHGDTSFWTNRVIPLMRKNGISQIVQLGDFGYWEHEYNGIKYLQRLNQALYDNDMTVSFVDGNHENHTWLRQLYASTKGGPQPRMIRSNIWWLQRGSHGKFGEMSWLACGGAHSIDRASRIPGKTWWAEEIISEHDVNACRVAGAADVLFSHDCPLGVNPSQQHALDKDMIPETTINRHRLTSVMRSARSKLVIHGHWHEFHDDTTINGERIIGLNCNTIPGGWKSIAILHTDTLGVSIL